MNSELFFKLVAHASLGLYIIVLIWLLYALRNMVRNQATRFIYATLCFWLFLAVKDIAYIFGDTWSDPQISNILMSIDLWPTPMIAILLLYALQPKWLNLRNISCMLAPFFVFTVLNIIFKGDEVIFMINQIYGFCFASIFGFIIYVLTFKCDKYINANYSNKAVIDIRWVRYVTILMYAICSLWFFMALETTWLGDALYYLTTSVLATSLFYYTMRHKEVVFPNYMALDTIISSSKNEDVDQESSVSMRQFTDIEKSLDAAMNLDKLYLNPHLSLSDLAKHIGTNRTYLSRYINSHKATPFINYINFYRCAEAERLLQDPSCDSLSMVDVAERCGFASYSTFRRVFKQNCGYSPSKYCKGEKKD